MLSAAPRWVWPTLVAVAAASLVHALMTGSVPVSLAQLWQALRPGAAPADSSVAVVLWDLRLPRALSAFAAGGLLALAGALLQALLRNPLADPFVLGVSGGASVAALGVMVLWGAALPLWVLQGAAALGALLTLLLLFALARRALWARELDTDEAAGVRVLLTGVMLAAFFGASVSVLLALAGDGPLRGMVFWLLGDLSGATDKPLAALAWVALAGCALVAQRHAGALNLMLRGEALAFTQGVDVVPTRRLLVAIAALATASAVSLAGAIGFVGFVAPHLMRTLLGSDQRTLLPATVLAGGTLVVLADSAARTVMAPVQLPVGVVTALVGVPVFLFLMQRR